MKSKVIFEYQNEKAVEDAQNLGMPKPKPIERLGEFYFDLEYVHAANINFKGEIIIYLPSGAWILNYNDELWNRIKAYLMKR